MSVDFEFHGNEPSYNAVKKAVAAGKFRSIKFRAAVKGEGVMPKSPIYFHMDVGDGSATCYRVKEGCLITMWGSGDHYDAFRKALSAVARHFKTNLVSEWEEPEDDEETPVSKPHGKRKPAHAESGFDLMSMGGSLIAQPVMGMLKRGEKQREKGEVEIWGLTFKK